MKSILFISLLFISVVLSAQNNAQFISQTAPDFISPGETFNFSVTFKNTGTTTWTRANRYSLGTQSPQDNTLWMNTNRVKLPNSVSPGQEVTFYMTLTAPTEEGMYAVQWQMVQDGVEWFGDKSEAINLSNVQEYPDSLLIEGNHFKVSSHIVSTSFFCWYGPGEWQVVVPWIPVDGRESWDGSQRYWRTMIKQLMAANIDVVYVELIPTLETNRGNFFLALKSLRAEGWNVPKVCPFLDPEITYKMLRYNGDCSTEAGKDELIGHYIRFYKQFFNANTDEFADDYVYTQDGHPVLNIWHIQLHIDNYDDLRRSDVTNRLRNEFGAEHPIFNNSIKMINNAYSPCFSFTDERIYQFEMQKYKIDKTWNGIKSSLLKPGYWDQNVRNPGYLLHRDGGRHYSESWDKVNADASINRVYIESFNEYDEGSGIYAAKTDVVYRKTDGGMNNTGNDKWSSDNDSYEYIKTTAAGAAKFNDFEKNNAKILYHNIPDKMVAGETFTAKVIIQNTGNASWSNAENYKFGQQLINDAKAFGPGRYFIDDNEDEIPVYGGIFRGRAKTFDVEIVAPSTPGSYETHWQMVQEGVEWFGQTITKTIQVIKPTASTDIDKQNLVSVYPNPAKPDNLVYIKGNFSKNNKISIYNISGLLLFEKVFKSNKSNFKIKPSEYGINEGVYIFQIESENGIGTKKIIIKN